jgi:hypothetical protein
MSARCPGSPLRALPWARGLQLRAPPKTTCAACGLWKSFQTRRAGVLLFHSARTLTTVSPEVHFIKGFLNNQETRRENACTCQKLYQGWLPSPQMFLTASTVNALQNRYYLLLRENNRFKTCFNFPALTLFIIIYLTSKATKLMWLIMEK